MCVYNNLCVCVCVYNNCAVTWDDAVYTHVVVELACMVSLDTEERVGGAEATGGGRGGWRGSWSGQEKLCVFERERERESESERERRWVVLECGYTNTREREGEEGQSN